MFGATRPVRTRVIYFLLFLVVFLDDFLVVAFFFFAMALVTSFQVRNVKLDNLYVNDFLLARTIFSKWSEAHLGAPKR